MKITEYFILFKLFMQAHHNLTENELKFIIEVIEVMKEHKKTIKKTAPNFNFRDGLHRLPMTSH